MCPLCIEIMSTVIKSAGQWYCSPLEFRVMSSNCDSNPTVPALDPSNEHCFSSISVSTSSSCPILDSLRVLEISSFLKNTVEGILISTIEGMSCGFRSS